MEKQSSLESVTLCSGRYSLRADVRLNLWLTIGIAPSLILTRYLVEHHAEWTAVTKAAVLLVPLIPCVLQVCAYLSFVRGLDELQRKIQSEAWLFAVIGTLLTAAAINTVNTNAVTVPFLEHGLGLPGVILLNALLWPIGGVLANRRYK